MAFELSQIFPPAAIKNYLGHLGPFRLFLALALLIALMLDASWRTLTLEVLAEAYIAVSCFVAATLALFYALEHAFNIDTRKLLRQYTHFQVPLAAFLGALPGCGGAIIVVTQFVRGRISFGSVVAVLIATMGDAAFLLLAQEPLTAALIFAIGLVMGTLFGYIIDRLHSPDFLRPEEELNVDPTQPLYQRFPGWLNKVWISLIVPGFILAVLSAFQIAPESPWITYFGALGALLCVLMWGYIPSHRPTCHPEEDPATGQNQMISMPEQPPTERVIQDTNFVTVWVVFAFLAYEWSVFGFGLSLESLFDSWLILLPLIAILVGFIPGCGPQILVTTLYLQGLIPLSAQIGNAISNDGDALFPAIALAPKASIVATIYSAIPALIMAYTWMYFFETGT